MNPLHTLRISIARVAQSMGIDNHLGVTGRPYEELAALAMTEERGWNALCAQAIDHAERLQQDNEALRRQYHESEASASREEIYDF